VQLNQLYIPYDAESLGIEVFKKAAVQTTSLPSVQTASSLVRTIFQKAREEAIAFENRDVEPFPVTQHSYLTDHEHFTTH